MDSKDNMMPLHSSKGQHFDDSDETEIDNRIQYNRFLEPTFKSRAILLQ